MGRALPIIAVARAWCTWYAIHPSSITRTGVRVSATSLRDITLSCLSTALRITGFDLARANITTPAGEALCSCDQPTRGSVTAWIGAHRRLSTVTLLPAVHYPIPTGRGQSCGCWDIEQTAVELSPDLIHVSYATTAKSCRRNWRRVWVHYAECIRAYTWYFLF